MFQDKKIPAEVVLGSRTVVNTSIRTEEQGRGLLIVVPRKKSRGIKILSFFFFIPKEQRLVLDELGREVFEHCRRESVVSDIIDNFRKKHNFSDEFGRRSVLKYLDSLARKGVIGFLVDADGESAGGEKGSTEGAEENVRGKG